MEPRCFSRWSLPAPTPWARRVFGEAYSGGGFAHELRYAGYSAVVVQGKAAGKVYLRIKVGEAEIRGASQLWGKAVAEVEKAIRQAVGDNEFRIAGTGQAEEKMVRFRTSRLRPPNDGWQRSMRTADSALGAMQ